MDPADEEHQRDDAAQQPMERTADGCQHEDSRQCLVKRDGRRRVSRTIKLEGRANGRVRERMSPCLARTISILRYRQADPAAWSAWRPAVGGFIYVVALSAAMSVAATRHPHSTRVTTLPIPGIRWFAATSRVRTGSGTTPATTMSTARNWRRRHITRWVSPCPARPGACREIGSDISIESRQELGSPNSTRPGLSRYGVSRVIQRTATPWVGASDEATARPVSNEANARRCSSVPKSSNGWPGRTCSSVRPEWRR